MEINRDIFKAYDVRGLYPGEFDETVARLIGRGFAAYLGTNRVGVSRDMRVSSPTLAAAFIDGVREQGVDVIDYGMLGTDMLYFAVARDGLGGGAQITASHNPKQYNGIKMVRQGAQALSGDAGIGDIRDMILRDRLPRPAARRGALSTRTVVAEYVEKVLSFIDTAAVRPFSVVLDAGSGMAGLVAPALFGRLPCRVTTLCFEIDGTFPSHEANPLIEENRRDITEEVVRRRADIGIAWDGDADRCFFIDGTGEFVSGDFVTALLAEAFLLKHPGSTIVYDLRASHAVRDTVARYGGRALRNRVGHAFIKRRMRDDDAVFGGEVTGHYYFRDFYYADNGFIPALLMLELMSKKNQSLHELLEPFRQRYFISGEINTRLASMADVPRKLSAIEARYRDAAVDWTDGVSIDYPDWHFNVRPSNTEPLLRLNLEAATPELMTARRDDVLALIRG
ncbi:MAG: phosphomannomutase/phosphoglucomutase [Acidobacteria bacterium RIFCSPLOWO2_02_FULL_68_18]|nr:MAG: phosphomannomutase/phosphoglucomutase [Acidobacteria bacterium RIFCSPLOWO2_02_FULL_68_18]OFW50263.1 MAG: phosphomannomutase/phosphoglucomutase [Acidobacteria bacterium RIFCSPLOWO2_12_FULL_68_19]